MTEVIGKMKDFLSKKGGVKIAVAVGVVGIMLIFISDFIPKDKSIAEYDTGDADTQEYVDKAEAEIREVVRSITGESSPTVYITASSGISKVFAVEVESEDSSRKEKTVIIKNSGGEQTGLLIRQTQPVIQGVVVVSEGAANPVIKEKIISAVKTAFDISSDKVCVVSKYK